MKSAQHFKRILSALLVLILVFSMMPITTLAADSSRTNDTIFFASDLHQLPTKLTSLLKKLSHEPGLVVLGGDYVSNTNSSSLVSVTEKIHSVYPDAQTFFTYGKNDTNVSGDGTNPFAFARTGEYYTGEDYYVYAVDYADMADASSASAAASRFISWANGVNSAKVIFVVCHMPIHQSSGQNLGGAAWMDALNQVGQSHDVAFLWGSVNSADANICYIPNGSTLTPEGGSTGTINFTYVNAGYIQNGYGTMALINDDSVSFVRYRTTGIVSTNTMSRKFLGHQHSWSLSGTVEATCAENGSKTYTCGCGQSYSDVIYATGKHSNTTTVVEATCTENGSTTTTCTTCGKTSTVTTLALGHNPVVDEAISTDKVTFYRCSVCGIVTGYESHDNDHVFILERVEEATCTEDGMEYYVCNETGCGKTKEEVIEAMGHQFVTVTRKSSCAEEGTETYTCMVCGYSESVTIPAQKHVYLTSTVAATCTSEGSITTTCANCDFYEVEILPVLGHTEEIMTTAATCALDGAIVTMCADCGESETEILPATGHTYETSTVAATCTNYGYTTHTCTTCDSYYTSDRIDPLGHDYASVVTAPTCTSNGFTTNTCTACGHSTVTDNTIALGHNYVGTEADGSITYTCANCNDSYTEEIAGNFTYSKATKFSTGDGFVITLYYNKTYYALSHKNNQISVVPVTVVNNEITSDVTEDMLWKHSSKKLYYKDGNTTYYLTAGSSAPSVATSGAASITYSSSKLKLGSKYLRYASNVLSLGTSGTTTYLYKQN